MRKVICGVCKMDLSDRTDLSSNEDLPCPQCGSKERAVHIKVEDNISVSDYLTATGREDGRAIAFRESERQGRVTSADENEDGSLSYRLTGTCPQGEEDTLFTCEILVKAFNAAGANWGGPSEPEEVGVADCIALDRENSRNVLSIQVVRAVVDSEFWSKLSKEGGVLESGVDKNTLIACIKDSINKKASDRKIPRRIRQSVILALDATRLPVMALDSVVFDCRNILGTWINSLGFQSVWLVGPTVELAWQLDQHN